MSIIILQSKSRKQKSWTVHQKRDIYDKIIYEKIFNFINKKMQIKIYSENFHFSDWQKFNSLEYTLSW